MTTPAYPSTVRDDVLEALHQHPGATVAQLADMVPTGGSGLMQIQRALRQLEARGLAVRQRGHSYRGGIGWAPDLWRAGP
jgi:hypothetical protein